jgi:gas vesicle protein
MENQTELRKNNHNGFWGFLTGALAGGLVGAAIMLLVAPQSGKRTRAKIQQKSIELNEMMTNAVDDAVAQTRHKAHQIQGSAKHLTEAIQQRGQAVVDEQKERLNTLVDAGKTAAKNW